VTFLVSVNILIKRCQGRGSQRFASVFATTM